MQSHKISVIIPVYNVKPYLRECLDSVLNQTHHNLQIIVIDDGSTDGCAMICDEYAEKDDRITVKHQKNAGLSAARNTGIEMIDSDYVCFLDSDDYLMPSFCETMLNALLEQNVDVTVCGNILVDESGKVLPQKQERVGLKNKVISRDYFLTQCTIVPSEFDCSAHTKLYKTEFFTDVRYPIGTVFEDIVTTYCIGMLIDKAYYIAEPLYCYRMRKNSLAHDVFSIKDSQRLHQLHEKIFLTTQVSKEQEQIAKKRLADACYDCATHAIKTGTTTQKEELVALIDEIDKAEETGSMEIVRIVRKWAIKLERAVLKQAIHTKKECPINKTLLAKTAYRLMTKLQKK